MKTTKDFGIDLIGEANYAQDLAEMYAEYLKTV